MFSGIVETIGIIQDIISLIDCIKLTISPQIPFQDINIGDSIAVNGVCLTVTHLTENSFSVTAVPETLALTNLGQLTKRSFVNLERSLKLSARLGGHYVQGHVDLTGEIFDLQKTDTAWLASIRVSPHLMKYIVKKGYICIDGMSITIIDTTNDTFTVTLIPHTQEVTIVHQYQTGSKVNIEVDIIGKYVEKLLREKTL
jgi:riboflavin synthase